MSYHALARKWRPQRFTELVGQDHVVRALKHALKENKLHHALLFSGTRGVGKTTLGRLVSKGLNCEQGVTAEPCGECRNCLEIDQGRFVDLIEVDAASRTGVDDTRELLENVQYAPAHGRRKVYLIDEVHMLSKSAFNALLKTLEEPPPHVQFLLATTDPQKLPVTVLSRCLQFHLKRLPQQEIQQQLQTVLEKEGIESEPAALSHLARAADGSMRDGLSLLDQAIAFGGGAVRAADVVEMLGSIERDDVLSLLDLLASGEAAGLPEILHKLDEQGPDYELVLDELSTSLQQVALIQVVPGVRLSDDQEVHRAAYERLAASINAEDIQLYYQMVISSKRDFDYAPSPRLGFEMLMLRLLAFRPAMTAESGSATPTPASGRRPAPAAVDRTSPVEAARAAVAGGRNSSEPAATDRGSAQTAAERPDSAAATVSELPKQNGHAPDTGSAKQQTQLSLSKTNAENWPALAGGLPLQGMSSELARQCGWGGYQDDVVTLLLAPSLEHLQRARNCEELEQALSDMAGQPLKLKIEVQTHALPTATDCDAQAQAERMAAAEQALSDDPNVRALQERFGASIHPGSVEPLN